MAKLDVTITVRATSILVFLRELERLIPPPLGQHHSLTYAQFGSDVDGWVDQLCLGLRRTNGSDNYFIEDSDLDHETPRESAEALAAQIRADSPHLWPAALSARKVR